MQTEDSGELVGQLRKAAAATGLSDVCLDEGHEKQGCI